MKIGTVVEFIDRQKMTCAVVMELKGDRLHVITEGNREINLSLKRLSHLSDMVLDTSIGRDRLVARLKEIAARRETLMTRVDIRELWEILNTEPNWIDLPTMTGLCFPDVPDKDHESAVVRAFFNQRLYFKFDTGRFFPYPEEKVEELTARTEEENRRREIIEQGRRWVKRVMESPHPRLEDADLPLVEMLKAHYLYEKDSPSYALSRAVLADTGIDTPDKIFRLLVKVGAWTPDENIDLIRLEIPTGFPSEAIDSAKRLIQEIPLFHPGLPAENRRDLTHLPVITIDGQATLDFDDALSVEDLGNRLRVGIHITDVGEVIQKDTPLDRESRSRGSSIYMPDQRIPMIPPELSEDLCSLRSGEIRPALSIMVELDPYGDVLAWEIVPSNIRVKDQLTYQDANFSAEKDPALQGLVHVARQYRRKRLAQGALHISLPEIHIHLDESGSVSLNRINRESPSRLAVAEIMIMANALMAAFLKEKGVPAVFRSQPRPKERLYEGEEGTLFQNWMQRKLLSRFVLSPEAEPHSGLGLDAYVTGTSPIRKYFDLVTQRQIRSAFGLEASYSREEVEGIIAELEPVMARVIAVQVRRSRYWLLKFLEKRIGQKEEAIVLGRTRNGYPALIPEYMMECRVSVPAGYELKPEDVIRITIQHVDARNDAFNVFMS